MVSLEEIRKRRGKDRDIDFLLSEIKQRESTIARLQRKCAKYYLQIHEPPNKDVLDELIAEGESDQ